MKEVRCWSIIQWHNIGIKFRDNGASAQRYEMSKKKQRHANTDNMISHLKARSQDCEKRLLASSCLSVCPSVRMEQFNSHCTDFREI